MLTFFVHHEKLSWIAVFARDRTPPDCAESRESKRRYDA